MHENTSVKFVTSYIATLQNMNSLINKYLLSLPGDLDLTEIFQKKSITTV